MVRMQCRPGNSPRVGCRRHRTKERAYQPLLALLTTNSATLAMSSSESRPPNAGIAFLPLVTCVMTAFVLKPPSRYSSNADCSSVFSGMITFWPPAWQAAQLPEKICSPAAASAPKAGAAASRPAATDAVATLDATFDMVNLEETWSAADTEKAENKMEKSMRVTGR